MGFLKVSSQLFSGFQRVDLQNIKQVVKISYSFEILVFVHRVISQYISHDTTAALHTSHFLTWHGFVSLFSHNHSSELF